MTKEREENSNREEEMQTIIQRLKDSLNSRSNVDEEGRISRRCRLSILFEKAITNFDSKQLLPY